MHAIEPLKPSRALGLVVGLVVQIRLLIESTIMREGIFSYPNVYRHYYLCTTKGKGGGHIPNTTMLGYPFPGQPGPRRQSAASVAPLGMTM